MCGAQAATITTSTDQVTLDKDQTTFTVELRLQEDDPFSAAEFGIDLPSGMTLTGVEYLDEALRSTGQTPVVTRDNRTYFGFYAGSNAFQGSYQVARLTFTYTGDEDTQFALGHSKIVTLTEDGSVGDTSSAPFTVSVIRSDDSSGGGSSGGGGGSSSGGGTDIGDGEVPLDPGVFVDLEGHWAKDSALRSVSLGLFSGTSATTFSPDMTMSRSMMAMVFYRMAGSPAVSGTDSFTDTEKDSWYSTAVTWAAQQGSSPDMGTAASVPMILSPGSRWSPSCTATPRTASTTSLHGTTCPPLPTPDRSAPSLWSPCSGPWPRVWSPEPAPPHSPLWTPYPAARRPPFWFSFTTASSSKPNLPALQSIKQSVEQIHGLLFHVHSSQQKRRHQTVPPLLSVLLRLPSGMPS